MSEQLDLLAWQPSVVDACRAHYGGVCVAIYAEDMATVVRTEDCRDWCPLLGKAIEPRLRVAE